MNLLITKSDRPEVNQCSWRDVKLQLLITNLFYVEFANQCVGVALRSTRLVILKRCIPHYDHLVSLLSSLFHCCCCCFDVVFSIIPALDSALLWRLLYFTSSFILNRVFSFCFSHDVCNPPFTKRVAKAVILKKEKPFLRFSFLRMSELHQRVLRKSSGPVPSLLGLHHVHQVFRIFRQPLHLSQFSLLRRQRWCLQFSRTSRLWVGNQRRRREMTTTTKNKKEKRKK